ncbi:MAG: proteasome accessory factor PafA2 family protein, partial [Ilumatobacteraceae bacterium]
MERRIYGLENEYGVTCTLRGQRRLSPDEVARYLFRKVVSWGRSSNVFLQNGARLYLDVGSHPEYATPECDSLYDLVVHDKAGERILEGLLQSAEQRLELLLEGRATPFPQGAFELLELIGDGDGDAAAGVRRDPIAR